MIKNAKFSGLYFYMNKNILGDFQICISVPLKKTPGQLFPCDFFARFSEPLFYGTRHVVNDEFSWLSFWYLSFFQSFKYR